MAQKKSQKPRKVKLSRKQLAIGIELLRRADANEKKGCK